jgi:hypothetical protein
MKPRFRPLAILLAILGVADLVMVPFMANASPSNGGPPPMPAIVLSGVLGAVTLVSIAGLAQGRRWGFRAAMISRAVQLVNYLLGAAFGPGLGFKVVGVLGLALSIPAIVLLARLRPRRAVPATSGA